MTVFALHTTLLAGAAKQPGFVPNPNPTPDPGDGETVNPPTTPPAEGAIFLPPSTNNTINVTNDSELASAISSASSGSHIALNGTFTEFRTISRSDLVFRSQAPLSGLVRGRWTINGSGTMLYQLDFAGNNSWPTINGADFKAYRNRFRDNKLGSAGQAGVRLMRCQGLRPDVACNEFTNSNGSIWTFNISGGCRLGKFRRNYIHDIDHNDLGISSALVACGQSGFDVYLSNGGWLYSGCEITDNLLVDVDVNAGFNRECLMAKANGVVISRNTLERVRGYINCRYGRECRFERNWIEDSFGIFTFGDLHEVNNNRLINSGRGIDVFGGNYTLDQLYAIKQSTGKWEEGATRNSRFARNVLEGNNIEVGARSDSSHTVRVQGITVEATTGSVVRGILDHSSTSVTGSTSVANDPATKLTTADVGRNYGL